ncbi:MAG: peptidylprolyl isomerase [Patescibacteria group bacterium]
MANPINSPTVIGGIAVLVVVTAIILGLTGFKLKPTASNSNQNANVNLSTKPSTAVPTYSFPGRLPDDRILNKQARLVTNKGTIVFTLDASQAPLAVSNFVYLAEQGFYNGIRWHRIETWVVQMGDPQTKDETVSQNLWGTGGPGYTIPDETVTGTYDPGVVAMAKTAASNSAGSQIFIMKSVAGLEQRYQIMGKVTTGMDVVQALVVGDTVQSVTIELTS